MKWRNMLVVAAVLTLLTALVRWGGTARPGPLFVAGVALFISIIFTFGLLLWWLYFSVLPAHVSIASVHPLKHSACVNILQSLR